jgi:hypothetical protein
MKGKGSTGVEVVCLEVIPLEFEGVDPSALSKDVVVPRSGSSALLLSTRAAMRLAPQSEMSRRAIARQGRQMRGRLPRSTTDRRVPMMVAVVSISSKRLRRFEGTSRPMQRA